MHHQEVLLLCALAFVISIDTQRLEANVTGLVCEPALSKVESRLNLASKMLETARKELHNELKELCQNNSCKADSSYCRKRQITHAQEKPMDCSDIYDDGYHTSGIYQIWPHSKISNGPLLVYCDMEDGGGWTVIQRRGDFENPSNYFYLDWNEYKTGFGHLLREFWIGNDNLFSLTNQKLYQLKIDLTDWGQNSVFALYQEFWVDEEIHNYTLHLRGYNGTAGDSLEYHNGKMFSTKDRNNDISSTFHCAKLMKGAWWYSDCLHSNLNGLYFRGNNTTRHVRGVVWKHFKGFDYSLKDTVMKIRRAG